MSRREDRKQSLAEDAQRFHQQAQNQVTASVWDRDPIKQYVRRFGWLRIIQDYVERRQKDGVDRPLRYLTIPGSNASDIGLLWRAGLLDRTNDGFPYVAICDETSAEEVMANLGKLLGYSGRLFHKAVKWPQGELCSLFPFDVINLDLCGAVITGALNRDTAKRRLTGIRWIFRLQRGQGFILLLTASADDRKARNTFEGVLADNLDNEDAFREAYLSRYGTLDPEPYQQDYRALTQVIIPKIIARMAMDCGYRITEHFVAKYDRKHHKMMCHSFEFEFLSRRKAQNRYEPYFKEVIRDEVDENLPSKVRIRAVNAYTEFIPTLVQRDPPDIKAILDGSPNLESELQEESVSLIGWWALED
jgi:hypothetical protein